ncbi:hypothetical protein VIGAN_07143100, partial [Vigna angularis var. angularis]
MFAFIIILCKVMNAIFTVFIFVLIFPSFADPYLNTDAGTMSPFEHAEVFILDDSGEFVIEKERRGDYGRGEVKLGQPWGSLL